MNTEARTLPTAIFALVAITIAIAAIVAAVLLLSGKHAQATHAEPPTEISRNTTCGAQGQLRGQSWTEFKIDQSILADKTFTDDTLSVTIRNFSGTSFDWSSNIGLDAVFVKGGNVGGFLYQYDPEATSDTGLTTPKNPNDQPANISHISFCYDLPDTTPTPPATATATAPAGATPTATPTATLATTPTPTSAVLGVIEGPTSLPDTGGSPEDATASNLALLLGLAGLALLSGAGTLVAVAVRRRR